LLAVFFAYKSTMDEVRTEKALKTTDSREESKVKGCFLFFFHRWQT
jgi:hypothetical protein